MRNKGQGRYAPWQAELNVIGRLFGTKFCNIFHFQLLPQKVKQANYESRRKFCARARFDYVLNFDLPARPGIA